MFIAGHITSCTVSLLAHLAQLGLVTSEIYAKYKHKTKTVLSNYINFTIKYE